MKPPASGNQALQRIVPFVFASALLLYFGFVYWTADKTPTRVATHFGSNGQANGWMSHSNYLLFLSLTPFVLMLLFKGIAWMTRHLPARYINIPRREYWLAPERRATTVDYICAWLTALQCLLLLFFAMNDYFIILANRVDPPRISMSAVLLSVVGFLIALLAWTTAFLLRLGNTNAAMLRNDTPAEWEKRAPGWHIRCRTCGFTEPWGKYGIRLFGAGTQTTFGWCAQCRRIRLHRIERTLSQ